MQRIAILGCAASGKSTLARTLGARLGLPVVHLDTLYYRPGWKPIDHGVFRERVAAAVAADRWIIDGSFARLVGDLTFTRADTIVLILQPRWLSMTRMVTRFLKDRGKPRGDLPAGCDEAIERDMVAYIWNFDRVSRPMIEQVLAETVPGKSVVRLNGDRAVAAWLSAV